MDIIEQKYKNDISFSNLSKVVHFLKYAKYLKDENRRESWDESVLRNMNMHLSKYPHLVDEIVGVYEKYVMSKSVFPSMRSLQFGGKPMQINEVRGYNCSFMPADNYKFFPELMFLLLGGVGVGYSVQKHHIDKLPVIMKPTKRKKFVVSDDIVGWSEAVRFLMKAYFCGKFLPDFCFDDIRAKGEELKTSGGVAPGPKPLKKCLKNITNLLDSKDNGSKLTSLEVHDIACFIADAIMDGNIRSSAMIALFSPDDTNMLKCKGNFSVRVFNEVKMGDSGYSLSLETTWNNREYDVIVSSNDYEVMKKTGKLPWFYFSPWRCRANNSVYILRDSINKEEFDKLWAKIKASGSGEPGIIFTNNTEYGFNPCQPEYATVLTRDGIRQFKDIDIGSEIWGGNKWVKVINKWSTGIKPVYRYNTSSGYFLGTENHRVVQDGDKIEVKDALSIDRSLGPETLVKVCDLDPQDVMDGLVIGDGTVHKASNNLVLLHIGSDDIEYTNSEVGELILKGRRAVARSTWEVRTTICYSELPKTLERTVPHRFLYGSDNKKAGFLRGLFSANGSCLCGSRLKLKQSSYVLIRQVQEMLSSLGIPSYIVKNKPRLIRWSNGNYVSNDSYELNVTTGRELFKESIGFIQSRKNNNISGGIGVPKKTFDIQDVEYIEDTEVFDITVDSDEHVYWTGGCLVSNCAEASLRPYTLCNLTEINAGNIVDQEDLNERSKAASFLGTLQAGYTDFNYLRHEWKENTEADALLGVSMTGVASIEYTEFDFAKAARCAVEENKRVAKLTGIKPAKRVTTLKPAGTSSLVASTSSGCHAWIADKYIRRIKISKTHPIYAHLKNLTPEFVEDDMMNPSVSAFAMFPLKAPEGAKVASTESIKSFLDRVYLLNNEWIAPGHVHGDNKHNVSATAWIKPDEWDFVREWIWNNKNSFSGISVLPYDGGTYPQMPFEPISEEKYAELISKVVDIDLSIIKEFEDNTNNKNEPACSGGSCEIF